MNKTLFICLIIAATLISCKNNDDELNQLSTDVSSLSSQLSTLQQSLTTLSNVTSTNNEGLTSTLSELSADIEEIQDQLDMNATTANVSSLQEQVNVLSNHINVLLKNAKSSLTLNISGLENLGSDFAYEGWLIVDGSPVSAGIFNVNAAGKLSQTKFEVNAFDAVFASAYVLTIEPSPDSDPSPSKVHILAGDFTENTATISVNHSAAIGTDFMSSTGNYTLATPTDGASNTHENSGVWWLDLGAGPGPGLSLPTLPDGWRYEGWAVIGGTPVSTGTFTSTTMSDSSALFSATVVSGPPFPGEDFLMNAPSGLSFPTNLASSTVVISVEPFPDNSSTPFLLKPLVASVPANAVDHTLYAMTNNASATNPVGAVSR